MNVAAMIETARLTTGASVEVDDPEMPGRRRRVGEGFAISPHGRRFVSLVVRGDISGDRVVADVITARLDDLRSATQVRSVATLSGRFRGNTDLIVPFGRIFKWVGDDAIALRWEDARGKAQAFRVDLESGVLTQLTHHTGGIKDFTLTPQGVVIYATPAPKADGGTSLLETGGLVRSRDGISLASGALGPTGFLSGTWDVTWFIQRPGEAPRALDVSGQGRELFKAPFLSVSPDGRWLAMPGTPAIVPASWDRYVGGFTARAIADERVNPRDGALARQLMQLYLVDVETGRSRIVLAAPFRNPPEVTWAPDSQSFLFGPTYLPTGDDEPALTGNALVEIEAVSGHMRRVPALERRMPAEVPAASPAAQTAIRIELRQNLNTPPHLFAIETNTGAERLIFDPNPQLATRFALGRVERLLWRAADNRQWSGMLYYPVGYRRGERCPLVIQTHGHAGPGEFSLNGLGGGYPALGVGISIYAAQPLAGRGMFVLQVEDQSIDGGGRVEVTSYQRAYEAAIAELDRVGLIDVDRIGLAGFSRTGWHVLYALTHSEFEFATAIVSDNIDAGYFQGTLMPGYFLNELGALSFAEGLENWLEHAPGFSAERIRTPLRLQTERAFSIPYLLVQWEMFSRLRQLDRPVEFNVVPDVLNGSHALQNPSQTRASQQGAVEWFDYWLNGTEPASIDRKKELHQLRRLRDDARATARAPLLDWRAVPSQPASHH